MKKTLVILFTLTIATFASADIKFDASTSRFYTIPVSPSINLDEYNDLSLQTTIMTLQCWNNGIYGKKVDDQIFSYLKTLNTPTSLRLLADLQKASA